MQMGGMDALSEALVAAHLPPVFVAQTSKDMELTGIVELVPQGLFKLVNEGNKDEYVRRAMSMYKGLAKELAKLQA